MCCKGNQDETVRPKYLRIKDEIQAKYVQGQPGNHSIPAERLLAREFGVSRMTVRRAVEKLEAETLVYRIQGGGTYTVEPGIVKSVKLSSFSEDIRARGMSPSSKVLLEEHSQADRNASWHLKISPGTEVFVLRRLRLANGEPMCLEEVTVPSQYVPDIKKLDLSGSFYEVLQRRYRLCPAWADQVVSAIVLEPKDVELLGVAPYSPALKIIRVTYDAKGRRIETSTSIYRGDKYTLHYSARRN